MEYVINDIEDYKANNENKRKQLQRIFSQINQRAYKLKESKDKNVEDLKKEIEKLKEENMRLKKKNENIRVIKTTDNPYNREQI